VTSLYDYLESFDPLIIERKEWEMADLLAKIESGEINLRAEFEKMAWDYHLKWMKAETEHARQVLSWFGRKNDQE
jgi:ABC-type uncharacterized transport system YnjBCD substrate-binding protein